MTNHKMTNHKPHVRLVCSLHPPDYTHTIPPLLPSGLSPSHPPLLALHLSSHLAAILWPANQGPWPTLPVGHAIPITITAITGAVIVHMACPGTACCTIGHTGGGVSRPPRVPGRCPAPGRQRIFHGPQLIGQPARRGGAALCDREEGMGEDGWRAWHTGKWCWQRPLGSQSHTPPHHIPWADN